MLVFLEARVKVGQRFYAFLLTVVSAYVGPWRINNQCKKTDEARIAPIVISRLEVSQKPRRVMMPLKMAPISLS